MTLFRRLAARLAFAVILYASTVQSACSSNQRNCTNSGLSVGAVIGIVAGLLVVYGAFWAVKGRSKEAERTATNGARTATNRNRTSTIGVRTTTNGIRTTSNGARTATTTRTSSTPVSMVGRAVNRVETDPTLPPYVARPEPAQLPPVGRIATPPPPPYTTNASNMV
uniref:Uncharacterized protein n=1 Tax=Moniliophthora roreri TaxID=221103 RepID=A0A0W0F2B1_MONRR